MQQRNCFALQCSRRMYKVKIDIYVRMPVLFTQFNKINDFKKHKVKITQKRKIILKYQMEALICEGKKRTR